MASRTTRDSMFTPSGPHASQPLSRGTRINIGGPAPPNETPAEKVSRLRDAARRAKGAKESKADRVIAVGRTWADRAHRFTAYSLIGFTVIASVVVSVAVADQLLSSRKKRNEWFAHLKTEYNSTLAEAQQAAAAGTASELQLAFMQIDAEEEAKKQAKAENTLWRRTKSTLFGGFSLQEEKGGKLGIVGARSAKEEKENLSKRADVVKAVHEMMQEAKAKTSARTIPAPAQIQAEVAPQPLGSSLDELSQKAAVDASNASKSWWGWATGR